MNEQDNNLKSIGINVEPKEGERSGLLSCNKTNARSPSLGFTSSSPLISEEMQLDYLAGILVAIYLEQKRYGNKPSETEN